MRTLSLVIQDILSIQRASINFDDTGLILVEGWNYDTQRANGAGKTALFNSLAFGLYDKLPRKITASEILRRGCKSGFVEVSVLCGLDTWRVKRSRPKGVQFFKNDQLQDITQDEFESNIRLSYNQFLLTIYNPQPNSGDYARFLNSPDASKKEFLLQLLNLDQFAVTKKAFDKLIESSTASINVEDKKLSNARSKISAYEESLVDIDSLTNQVETLKSSISILDLEILELSNVPKPDLSKFQKIDEDLRVKQAEIAQAKARRSMLHDKYRELKSSISTFNTDASCSECGAILDNAAAVAAHGAHQKKIVEKMSEVKNSIDETDIIISKESGISDLYRKLIDKKQQVSIDYQKAQSRISDLKSLLRNKNQQIQDASLRIENNSELLNKINSLHNSAAISLETIASDKKNLELYKTLSAIHSPTGAPAYVLDSIVDSFNEIIPKYIDLMSPNMSYILNSFKETAKGDVVAKLSETLTKSGCEVSVGSLSGGEQKGLSLCVDFALLEVLETQFGMTLNPIILDEPFEGLDSAGREIVIDLLEALARKRQIFIVDHASEVKAMFTKTIRVELRNDISKLIEAS